MVWTHTPAQPAQQMPLIGPWFGRIMARLRASFAPAQDRTSSWPAAVLAASEQTETEAHPGTEGASARAEVGIAVTRIVPFQSIPAAALTPKEPAIPLRATQVAAPLTAPVMATVAPRFHSLDAEAITVVYVLSHRFGSGLICLDWLADHGLPFRRVGSIHPTSPVWSAPEGALVLVDLDTLGGISEMAEPLMRLRLNRPDIAVILLSEQAETHDFGTERLVLADISLRLPCAFASFEFALAEAPINNAAWQERLLGDHA